MISNTLETPTFTVEAPLLQFSLPSMTIQADSQAARSLARCAYVAGAYTGSPGVVYPFYPEGSNTPLYLYFGKVDNGGQRWMFQGQKTGSPFVTQGIMPESGAQITISGTPQNVRYDTYTGVVLTKLFEGDFSVTIVTDGNYLIPSMAWREAVFNPVETFSYRGTSGAQNVWWVTFNSPYGWTGTLSPALTTTGLYWNSWSGINASWATMYLRYQRIGNSLTVNWGSAVDAINTQLLSATCTAGHLVGCSIASGGDGSFVDIVGYTGTLYEYVAPSSLSNLTFSGTLQAKLPLVGCTVTLGGTSFVAKRITLWNVKVHLFDSAADATAAGTTKPQIMNCIVKSYMSGVVTFTAAPQTFGNDRILVVFVDAPDGTTVAIADATGRVVNASAAQQLPVVSFKTTGSTVTTSGTYVSSWGQASGASTSNSVTMTPAVINGGTVAARAEVSLVQNVFGSFPGVLTTGNYCLVSSALLHFGGTDGTQSVEYTMYILGRPAVSGSGEYSMYLGGYGTPATGVTAGSTAHFGRGPNGSMVCNTNWTNDLWNPGSGYAYPSTTGFEVWCLCKSPSYGGTETYRNNATPSGTQNTIATQRAAPRPSGGFQKTSYWRLGSGSSYATTGSTYIGAFLLYDTYHDNATRETVMATLEIEFGLSAT